MSTEMAETEASSDTRPSRKAQNYRDGKTFFICTVESGNESYAVADVAHQLNETKSELGGKFDIQFGGIQSKRRGQVMFWLIFDGQFCESETSLRGHATTVLCKNLHKLVEVQTIYVCLSYAALLHVWLCCLCVCKFV